MTTETAIAELTAAKNQAYSERDQLVCLLASLYPSWLARHPDSDTTWEDDWRWIVFIHLPDGKGGDVQASWHIHDSELKWFLDIGLKETLYGKEPPVWDGHTTDEKYQRVRFAASEHAAEKGCPLCGDYR